MSRIHGMMDVGKRSLMNSQTALQTTSHNIANKGTEGYSRQRVELQTNVPIGEGRLRIGMGARASAVRRINNEFLDKQLGVEGNKRGMAQSRSEKLARVEQVFNEQGDKGINHFVSEFFNSFRELSNNPESQATRTLVKENAVNLVRDFGRVNSQLKDIQSEIDVQITHEIQEINSMAEEIGSLNEKIQVVTLNGGVPNDELDRRDLLIRKLSEKVNIHVAESKDGLVNISAGNSALLVSGYDAGHLEVASTGKNDTKKENLKDIFFQSRNEDPQNVTRQFTGGTLGGLLDIRDGVINNLLQETDDLAYTLATEVNNAHSVGFTKYNQTGVNFFNVLDSKDDASGRLRLNDDIASDLANIATGIRPDAPGDNRVAVVIAQIQNQPLMAGGQSSLNDYYNGVVGQVGVMAKKANSIYEHQKGIVDQLGNVRESISGVSLDEEAIKMIEFQKSYDAAARVIKVADEMFDTVLSLKR